MGSGSSKPEASGGSRHVFSSNSPVQFSSNLVEALQSNTETDSTRTKSIELEIQARVASELRRLQEREQKTIAEIEARLAKDSPSPSSSSPPPVTDHTPGSLNLDAPRIPFAGRESYTTPAPTTPAVAEVAANRNLNRETVNEEIEALRAKLAGRRKLADLDEGVTKAKADVVSCLRLHDRRPLNCWQEVEGFKREVARLEEAFVDRIVG